MNDAINNRIIEEIATTIDVPDSAYETAEKRYLDLGSWLGRRESNCSAFNPHIYSQGSFRLGTVIRPLDDKTAYDLDLACNLEYGISKDTFTQEQLKSLVGLDVESYRVGRGILEPKEESHRCWRLVYADQLNFHLDIVPCIPEGADRRRLIEAAILKAGSIEGLAQEVANLTVSITDDRHIRYRTVTGDWNVSNPEGYARWFESRMMLATAVLEKRLIEAKAAKIDDLPTFRWKTPLQRCVQVLKRHRDIMFAENPDSKPISIIITTLSARAYRGESDLGEAMRSSLTQMDSLINTKSPRVPNPVNPSEDFADKWATAEGRAKKLEENFRAWLTQAKADFEVIGTSNDTKFLSEQAMQKFGSRLNPNDLSEKLGFALPVITVLPKSHRIVESPAKPWKQ
jgi:Cyclic GMP-AMP synthase DncV-like, nucleotidyltransferase domain